MVTVTTMLACIGGMCDKFVSIVAFFFSDIGPMVYSLVSCLSPFTLSCLIELETHTFCF